ncbi:DUF7670 domain-containing protein [Tamlana flava]|uniref:DUF7670 domain-containing protein n=1 Tax=Tamlana flava TaxID=3158572 RepID=UPI00351AC3DE
MKKSFRIYRLIIRILGLLALMGYILFLIDEGVPLLTKQPTFADISVYMLFAIFLAAFICLWKYELISGILMLVWYGLVLLCIFEVWENAALVGMVALPISIIGIMVLIFGILKKRAFSS